MKHIFCFILSAISVCTQAQISYSELDGFMSYIYGSVMDFDAVYYRYPNDACELRRYIDNYYYGEPDEYKDVVLQMVDSLELQTGVGYCRVSMKKHEGYFLLENDRCYLINNDIRSFNACYRISFIGENDCPLDTESIMPDFREQFHHLLDKYTREHYSDIVDDYECRMFVFSYENDSLESLCDNLCLLDEGLRNEIMLRLRNFSSSHRDVKIIHFAANLLVRKREEKQQ